MKDSKALLKEIDILVLVGGKGKRLKDVTKDIPKPLVDIHGVPFLSYLLNYLIAYGFRRFILCTGYNTEYFHSFVETYSGSDIDILVSNEANPLGTAGAVKNAKKHILSDYFIVINGDTYCEIDYNDFINCFYKLNIICQMALFRRKHVTGYGVVEISEDNKVISIKGKSNDSLKGNYVDAGTYIFSKQIMKYIPTNQFTSMNSGLIVNLINNKIFPYGYILKEKFFDIGTPERYKIAKTIFT